MDETLELLIEAHKIIKSHAKAGGPYEEWLTKAGKALRPKLPTKTVPAAVNLTEDNMDTTPLTFGRYKGKTPFQVLTIDPSYLVWLDREFRPTRISSELANQAKNLISATRGAVKWI